MTELVCSGSGAGGAEEKDSLEEAVLQLGLEEVGRDMSRRKDGMRNERGGRVRLRGRPWLYFGVQGAGPALGKAFQAKLSNCLHAGGQGAREDCQESSDKCRTSVF